MKTFTFFSVLAFGILITASSPVLAQEQQELPVTEATVVVDKNSRQPARLQPASLQSEYKSVEESKARKKENKALGQEARQTQQEYKKLEMEAKKAERSAKQVENEIIRAEKAERRAIKSWQEADMQEEKTRRAIDRYLGN
ncbi:hypothetical protein BH24BAC1_BH24BAC1_22300 [soil metagenome]